MKHIISHIAAAAFVLSAVSCGNNESGRNAQSADDGGCVTETVCGGYTQWREVTDNDLAIYTEAIGAFVESSEVCTEEGCKVPAEIEALADETPAKVRTQVVAGVNYQFRTEKKVVTIFKPLPGQGSPAVSAVDDAQ